MRNVFSFFPTYFAPATCVSKNLFLNLTVGLYKALDGLGLKYIFDLLLRYESSSPPQVCLLFPESTPNTMFFIHHISGKKIEEKLGSAQTLSSFKSGLTPLHTHTGVFSYSG